MLNAIIINYLQSRERIYKIGIDSSFFYDRFFILVLRLRIQNFKIFLLNFSKIIFPLFSCSFKMIQTKSNLIRL